MDEPARPEKIALKLKASSIIFLKTSGILPIFRIIMIRETTTKIIPIKGTIFWVILIILLPPPRMTKATARAKNPPMIFGLT